MQRNSRAQRESRVPMSISTVLLDASVFNDCALQHKIVAARRELIFPVREFKRRISRALLSPYLASRQRRVDALPQPTTSAQEEGHFYYLHMVRLLFFVLFASAVEQSRERFEQELYV